MSVPVPGVTPLVLAAIPIAKDLTADLLYVHLDVILVGLTASGIRVISYACDGTEVERSVERILVDKAPSHVQYTIKNPRIGQPNLALKIPIFEGRPIAIIQDSKHALKTIRNNMFSGARMLVFGNYSALYRRIQEMGLKEGSPLYKRDILRLDRQDDNAATRLFCADVLAFLAFFFPEYVLEIVLLFVFGELIDTYQNRSMMHIERIKIALRARYFLDSWEAFLDVSGYKKTQHFLSRESVDIFRIIIEGIISLIIVHRDHIQGVYPLLPWLHSSEACEHVFGDARKIVKDFSMLDFFYLIPKLRIKMREAVLRGTSSDPKKTASGYCHTYFDNEGADLLKLAIYPSDTEIRDAAEQAAQEADSLVELLGVKPSQLRRMQALASSGAGPTVTLPSIGAWFEDDSDIDVLPDDIFYDDEASDDVSDAQELQFLLDREENTDTLRPALEQDNRIMRLTCANLSVIADEQIRMYGYFSACIGHCSILINS